MSVAAPACLPLAVVVPTTRPALLVDNLLRDLAACQPPLAELLVVLDGVAPSPIDEALRAALPLRELSLSPRQGPAAARNAGIEAAASDVVLLLDDDVRVAADLPARVAAHFERDELVALTGTFSADPVPTDLCSRYKNDYMVYICGRSASETKTLLTAVCAMRREAALAVGGFDASIAEATVEDIEFGQRMAKRGTVRFDPALEVVHLKRYTPWGLVTSHFRRSRDMARLLLAGLPGSLFEEVGDSQESLCLPRGFLVGVALAGLWLLAPLVYWGLFTWAPEWALVGVNGQRIVWIGWAGLPALVLLANWPFLAFVAKRRGALRALASGGLLFCEFVLSVIACGWAVLSWPAIGRRSS